MGGVDVFVLVTLWSTVAWSSGSPNALHYREESSSVVYPDHLRRTKILPIVLNGSNSTLYNKEINNTVEYIFEFTKLQVGHLFLPMKCITVNHYKERRCVEQYEIMNKICSD
jgi:hypothetical protein